MSAELRVRFVTRADYSEWLPLWEGYNQFYKRFGASARSKLPETADPSLRSG
jgi:hypothetical protein